MLSSKSEIEELRGVYSCESNAVMIFFLNAVDSFVTFMFNP